MTMPKLRILLAVCESVLTRPLRWLSAINVTLKMSRASDRGILRHLAYLIEAAAILPILAENGVDHLHVHFGTNSAAVARLIRRLGGPVYSMTVHGPVEFDAPIGFSLREKAIEAGFVVAISDFCFAQLCRWLPPDQWPKIHIVHCTAGDSYFESSIPIDDSCRMLLSIGRLDAQKGQVLLIDAIKIAVDQGVDVRLTLIGDGELRPLIEQRINSYGLSRHINITGWLDEPNIKNLLQQARALVQPSFAEGLPVVIMEAFAMARPVISTHVAAIPELVRHQVNGWLVPAGNVDDLVTAIKDAMTLPANTLNAMGQAGRDRAISRHSIKAQVTLLESLFDSSATSTTTV
jgi:glycosyltransferase involved in cell wall biosynthesis